uniref:EF-hand domain-containing protein n=1 Tax=Pyramimonas obovata TaxID=1411642 RepID=A0A7S0MXN7_9CHLO|mmetsp:Transcript_15906/g.34490  ORF Transcript_15906/g.34490 Transcript_15906/m.34490 type:complete len:464 (+) Transcript_15906:90-1481(+)
MSFRQRRAVGVTNGREARTKVENSPSIARSPNAMGPVGTRRNLLKSSGANPSGSEQANRLPPLSPCNRTRTSDFTEQELLKARQLQKILRQRNTNLSRGPSSLYRYMTRNRATKNGRLTLEHLRLVLDSLSMDASDQEVRALINLCSSDGVGVSYGDLCRSLYEDLGYDPDHNEFEERKPYHDMRKGAAPVLERAELLAKVDKCNVPLRSLPRADAVRQFQPYDTDDSGIITVEQFRRGMKRLNVSVTDDVLDDIVSAADKSNIGLVNYQEVIKTILGGSSTNTQNLTRLIGGLATATCPRSPEHSSLREPHEATSQRLVEDRYDAYDMVVNSQRRALGSNHCVPAEGTPGFAYDSSRLNRGDEDLVGCIGPSNLQRRRYEAKLQKMRANAQKIEEKCAAIEDELLQSDEAKRRNLHEARVNVERNCWQFRFPFDYTWEVGMAKFKEKVSLADLVGHQIHVVI